MANHTYATLLFRKLCERVEDLVDMAICVDRVTLPKHNLPTDQADSLPISFLSHFDVKRGDQLLPSSSTSHGALVQYYTEISVPC